MKITISPDAFKGSLSALEVAYVIEHALNEVAPEFDTVIKPMADGGEGSLDAVVSATNGFKVPLKIKGPLGTQINSSYGVIKEKIAFIECANTIGISLVPDDLKNPEETSSYGLGEAILSAVKDGYREIVIGLGGSSVNDGGLGMLSALGVRFLDTENKPVGIFGKNLKEVKRVDFTINPLLKDVKIVVASDVDNLLYGLEGATHIYGEQKGLSAEKVIEYDELLHGYAQIIEKAIGKDLSSLKGSGAAGGVGFALLSINAKIVQGASYIAQLINLEQEIKRSDLVITGEGRSDEQTLFGKAPFYVANLASKYNIPTILISGSVAKEVDLMMNYFTGIFSIINEPMTLEEAMKQTEDLLYQKTLYLGHMFKYFM